MTVLGVALQFVVAFVVSVALVQIPGRNRLRASILFIFASILLSLRFGGLVFAGPMALMVAGVLWWLRYAESHEDLFRATRVLALIWLALQVLHVPFGST